MHSVLQGNCRSDALPVTVLIVDSCLTCTASVNLLNLPIQRFASLSMEPGATVLATAQQVRAASCFHAADSTAVHRSRGPALTPLSSRHWPALVDVHAHDDN